MDSHADGLPHSHSHNAPDLFPATGSTPPPEGLSEDGGTEPEAHRLRVSSGHDIESAMESFILRWPTDAVPKTEQQCSHGSVNAALQQSDARSMQPAAQPDSLASHKDAALEQRVLIDHVSGRGVGDLQSGEHLGGSTERQPGEHLGGSAEEQPGEQIGGSTKRQPGGVEGQPGGTARAHPPGGSCAALEPESDSRGLDLDAWPVLLTDGSISGSDDEHCFPRRKDMEAFRVKRGKRRPAIRYLFESFD